MPPPSQLTYPAKIKFPSAGLPGQGVEMFLWLLKHRVRLFSQDLTPSSRLQEPGLVALLPVSRASAPLGTALPGGRARRHSQGTCSTHSSPRVPGFRGESPLKMLRQWVGGRDGLPWAHRQPTSAHTQVSGAGSHHKPMMSDGKRTLHTKTGHSTQEKERGANWHPPPHLSLG